jgi:hypothetical protein
MKVKDVCRVLDDAVELLEAAGANTQGKGLKSLLEVFKISEGQSVDEFIADLRVRLTPAELKGQTDSEPKGTRIEQYVRTLQEAGTDELKFQSVFGKLERDKSINKADVEAIAASYTGGRSKWRLKKDAIAAIRTTFNERAYQAVKMLQVDKASRF